MLGLGAMCELAAGDGKASFLVVGLALLLRCAVALHSYSGEHTPPMFGDYEAQRHWMEITLHTPASEWYTATSRNNLSYWGLDYPPVTAYQSLLHGHVLHALDPEAVALGSSMGYESPRSKLLMRATVIGSDLLVFFPAVFAFVAAYCGRRRPPGERAWVALLVLLQPGFILIDHGHFQYNCISLGFAAAAAAALVAGRELLGSVLFCLSLNHKQMSMYYAPAIFAHLLGRSLQKRSPLLAVARLGAVVVATFVVCWWPFLGSTEAALQVLRRLVPLARGLYEDHVANFWCATSLLAKWKQRLPVPALAHMALAATLAAVAPAMWQQIRAPSARGLLLAMLNSSFGFFLFSFQVHEKSILLPLLPAALLAPEELDLVRWLAPMAAFSMFPLLVRDRLAAAYFALTALFLLLFSSPSPGAAPGAAPAQGRPPLAAAWARHKRQVAAASAAGAVVLHLAAIFVPAPARYPYLHAALMTGYAFAHFLPMWLYSNYRQWTIEGRAAGASTAQGPAKSETKLQ